MSEEDMSKLWMKVDAALSQNLAAVHARAAAAIKGDEIYKFGSEALVLKHKALAFCGNVHENRDKLPLPVEGSAFRHALGYIPGGGLACAAADAVLMVGSMGKSQVAQSFDGSSLGEEMVELRRRMSELEKESDALKNQMNIVMAMLAMKLKCDGSDS